MHGSILSSLTVNKLSKFMQIHNLAEIHAHTHTHTRMIENLDFATQIRL